jgi:hypothetical protein
MPRDKNINLPSKNSRTLKVYVSQEEYQQIQNAAIDSGLGLSDIMKLSWCQFRKSREEKPQTQATKQSDRNEEIRKQAIELSQRDYVESTSLAVSEILVKEFGFFCKEVREGKPALKIKKLWILLSPYAVPSEHEVKESMKDLLKAEDMELFELEA